MHPARAPRVAAALAVALAVALALALVLILAPAERRAPASPELAGSGSGTFPSDWFFAQRAYPHAEINYAALALAREQAAALQAEAAGARLAPWDPAGPTNIGGRIADLAIHPQNPLTVYVGAAQGGVLKTTDGGATWTPTFDAEPTLSIGNLAIDPSNPDVVYAGTGEPNCGGGSVTYGGLGIFKTSNAGVTWTNVGLAESYHIGRIVIDPTNTQRIFVAAMGRLFSTNPERGVYRSTDGGGTWEHVLAVTDSTGAIDLVIDPSNPSRVYAATWERIRHPHSRRYGGPTSAVYRSTNGGDTWAILGGGLPSPAVTNGRIGLAIAASSPLVLYAIYADQVGNFAGVYKTTNGGDTWTRTSDAALSGVYSTYGWWFGNIRVAPNDPNRVHVLGLPFYRSTTGGTSWSQVGGNMHVDHHALEWAPSDPTILYEGNDGGLYRSVDGGGTWSPVLGLPITQFYTCEVDFQLPNRRYGGAQDNGTNRTLTGALGDWSSIYGGDGFVVNVDPSNNSFVYAESQYGALGRSTNGGSSFSGATSGISGSDRKNWNTPVVLDPTNPAVLYYGANRLYRSANRAVSWTAISPDLTDGLNGQGGVTFGTITTIAAARTDPQVIYAGTDDANVWVTLNGGGGWTRIDAALPERWITRVAVDPTSAAIAYVTLSGFRDDDPLSHVFRTTDYGTSWTAIGSDLPEAPVNDLVIDEDQPSTLYVATDVGVYMTSDTGGSWSALGTGLPNGVVSDLELHLPTRVLTAGTYGRSMFTYDLGAVAGIDLARAAPPAAPRLHPAVPNPTRGAAVLAYELPRAAHAKLAVYDPSGRLVRVIHDAEEPAGRRTATWDGRAAAGRPVARGTYLVRLEADGVVRTAKLVVAP